MKNVFVYCEGQTEEAFTNVILKPYFMNFDVYVTPIVHKTKRTSSRTYRGGISSYEILKKEITMLCRNPNYTVTTMFDYYQMPSDTPGISFTCSDIYTIAETIEEEINRDIGCTNFTANLMMHEFESLLFSEPEKFRTVADSATVNELCRIRNLYDTPEHINNSVDTAPSKRILALKPSYGKVTEGMRVASQIGIDKMMCECRHFASWVERIKTLN